MAEAKPSDNGRGAGRERGEGHGLSVREGWSGGSGEQGALVMMLGNGVRTHIFLANE